MDLMDDDQLIAAVTGEMERYHTPIELVLQPTSAFRLCAILQLAKRHPDLPPDSREFIGAFLAHCRQYFAEAPAVLEMLRRGDDPDYDVPTGPGHTRH